MTVLACGGLGFMAGQGIVGVDGVHWWWPLLVVGAVGLLRLPLTGHLHQGAIDPQVEGAPPRVGTTST